MSVQTPRLLLQGQAYQTFTVAERDLDLLPRFGYSGRKGLALSILGIPVEASDEEYGLSGPAM
jgi:hypothetical protein